MLLGDAAPNTREQVAAGRARHGEAYWANSRFSSPTFWQEEAELLADKEIPVHTFHLIRQAEGAFRQLASMTNGENRFLDVTNSGAAGILTQFVCEKCLHDIGGDDYVMAYRTKFGYT